MQQATSIVTYRCPSTNIYKKGHKSTKLGKEKVVTTMNYDISLFSSSSNNTTTFLSFFILTQPLELSIWMIDFLMYF